MLRSSEFLCGTHDDELTEEAFQAALSPQSVKSSLRDGGDLDPGDDDIFENASQPEQWPRLQEIPTILVNGRRLSGSSNTGSHYVTAPDQVRCREGDGEVLEATTTSGRSERLSSEDQNTRTESSGTTAYVSTESPQGSGDTRRASSYRLSTNNVADEAEPATAQMYSSNASLHASNAHIPLTASRQSVRLSTNNVADEAEPATAQMYSSNASLRASTAHIPLTASRQSVRLSTNNVADEAEPATAQMYSSNASLHASDAHIPLTASRQSVRLSTNNVADEAEPATAQMYSSNASLHALTRTFLSLLLVRVCG
ncbi:hypothetical protein COOONC_11657 [Cooperia oncophora]